MDTDELRQFIVQKRELLSRETFSRRAFNRCEDMSDEMKNRYVEYLIERLENAELDNRAMKLVLEDLTKELSRSNRMLEKLNESQSLLEEERKSRKSLEQEIAKLKELSTGESKRFLNDNKKGVEEAEKQKCKCKHCPYTHNLDPCSLIISKKLYKRQCTGCCNDLSDR